MKKISISLACMALPVLMSAAEYYVVPGLKASGKDGSSWENALTMYDIFANDAATKKKESESIYKHGDVFYLAGGTYINSLLGGKTGGDDVRICHGYTFVGGCDPTKGPVTEWPTYPSATPTIFSGDLNENGIADEGDMCNLVCVRSGSTDGMDISHPENPEPATTFIGVDFTNSYSPAGTKDEAGAVHCTQGRIALKYCNIYGNVSDGDGSGDGVAAGIGIRGGRYEISDCNIYGNKGRQTGAGLRVTSRSASISRGVVERCYFGENEISGRYGAAIAYTSGDSQWLVNSTIVGNKAKYEGAGIAINGSNFSGTNGSGNTDERSVHIVNCTIAGNICTADPADLYKEDTNPGSWFGSQIRISADPAVEICNSIIVGAEDDGTIAKAAIMLLDEVSSDNAYLNSYGGSILGTFATTAEPKISINWLADNMDEDAPYTYATVFGDAVPAFNGGFTKTLIPRSEFLDEIGSYPLYGFEINDFVTGLVSAGHNLPFEISVDVDQNGTKRDFSDEGETAPGAYDYLAYENAGVESAVAAKNGLVAAGAYTWKTADGSVADFTVYSVTGAVVKTAKASSVNIADLAAGVYVVTDGTSTVKAIR
ncbi:MAG: T9SS type A sorting domain-containing protein [Bacteroidales bacterium]|nr:T9SS type A sorting domain-containing protein [Bacteroidales bacterium]